MVQQRAHISLLRGQPLVSLPWRAARTQTCQGLSRPTAHLFFISLQTSFLCVILPCVSNHINTCSHSDLPLSQVSRAAVTPLLWPRSTRTVARLLYRYTLLALPAVSRAGRVQTATFAYRGLLLYRSQSDVTTGKASEFDPVQRTPKGQQ